MTYNLSCTMTDTFAAFMGNGTGAEGSLTRSLHGQWDSFVSHQPATSQLVRATKLLRILSTLAHSHIRFACVVHRVSGMAMDRNFYPEVCGVRNEDLKPFFQV
jgi:hypothetical protein